MALMPINLDSYSMTGLRPRLAPQMPGNGDMPYRAMPHRTQLREHPCPASMLSGQPSNPAEFAMLNWPSKPSSAARKRATCLGPPVIGVCQVRHEPHLGNGFAVPKTQDERGRLHRVETKPVHAGIELQPDDGIALAGRLQQVDLMFRVHRQLDPVM
jgi:hypothetical protein